VNIYSFVAPDHTPAEPKPELREQELLGNVPSNAVQSIRAFRVADLQAEAARLGHHFLYAHCGEATTKHQVLSTLASAFHFPRHFGKNFDALSDCLTSLTIKQGASRASWWCLNNCPIRQNSTARRAKPCSTCSATPPTSGPTRKSRFAFSTLSSKPAVAGSAAGAAALAVQCAP
jgi:hypothetical protein